MEAPKLRIMLNDVHSNIPGSTAVSEGGSYVFTANLVQYLARKPEIEIISVLFNRTKDESEIAVNRTDVGRIFYDVVYPGALLKRHYQSGLTIARFRKVVGPLLGAVDAMLGEAKPDVVYVNALTIHGWLLVEAAHRRGIPTVVTHAGIWKLELATAKGAIAPSIRRIFSRLEKEMLDKATRQVFLNEHSKSAYLTAHGMQAANRYADKLLIIPHAAVLPATLLPVSIPQKSSYRIGMVARWDRIKNHAAMARLAAYCAKAGLPWECSVVTSLPPDTVSLFKERYRSLVRIVEPMPPAELYRWYTSQDIILIPSRFETASTVLIEATALGKPAIISDRIGWVDTYRRLGMDDLIITPAASGRHIATVIDTLIRHFPRYAPQYQQLQETIATQHDFDAIANQYYQLFKQFGTSTYEK